MTARLGLVPGLLLAAAVAAWWLAATRGALLGDEDAAAAATLALFVLSVARPMLASVVGSRSAGLRGYSAGMRAALATITAAWPLVAVLWLASVDSLARVLVIEAAVVGFALLVPLTGHLLRQATPDRAWTASAATLLGVALACGAWLLSDAWRPGFGG